MGEAMQFPDSWQEYLHQYEFRDDMEEYTNGAMLIPSFRVKQMMEYYLRDVVPVVRCKECTHSYFDEYGYLACAESGAMLAPEEGDYCSHGQWKRPICAGAQKGGHTECRERNNLTT